MRFATRSRAYLHARRRERPSSRAPFDRPRATKQALLSGEAVEDEAPDQEERAAELNEARVRYEAVGDALAEFVERAIAELRERAPECYAEIAAAAEEAEVKRQEAERLLAEAERHVAEAVRKRHWLDRVTGQSALGHFPFEHLPLAVPERKELHRAVA